LLGQLRVLSRAYILTPVPDKMLLTLLLAAPTMIRLATIILWEPYFQIVC